LYDRSGIFSSSKEIPLCSEPNLAIADRRFGKSSVINNRSSND
jgi:hypothetical protein